MRYLLDANVVSELMRDRPNEHVVRTFQERSKHCVLAASVLYELAHGIAILPDGARKRALADGLDALTKEMRVFSFDRRAALWLATANAQLRAEGKVTGVLDGQVAAVAATRGCIVVTRNVRHFENFDGLHVETWHG